MVTIETQIREFQCKVLNSITFTNEEMLKFKMTDSPLCSFCKREVESLEHLLYYCDVTETFWDAFCSWLGEFIVWLNFFHKPKFEWLLFLIFKNNVILMSFMTACQCR